MTITVRRLAPDDDRRGFRSGNVDLDRFFVSYAGQNLFRHHIGTTYVAVEGDVIVGFATVVPTNLGAELLPAAQRKGLPRHPLPALRLARIASDHRVRGQGVGGLLMRFVFLLARKMADELGCIGVVVDAKPEAVAFYQRLGFIELDVVGGLLGDRPQPRPMFVELARIPAK